MAALEAGDPSHPAYTALTTFNENFELVQDLRDVYQVRLLEKGFQLHILLK